MMLIFATLYILGVIALIHIARRAARKSLQARKNMKHVHDQYITDTLLERIDIPDDLEDEDVGVLFSERVSLDGYKSLN